MKELLIHLVVLPEKSLEKEFLPLQRLADEGD